MLTKLERLLSKSLTTLEVMTYYLVVHTGPGAWSACPYSHREESKMPVTLVTYK